MTTALQMQSETRGSGRPLVLVPGGLTGWLSWEPHAERLSASRNVTRVQLLNVQYGLEDRPLPANYSVRLEREALSTTLAELGIMSPVDLVAWSFGALVTLDFALNNQERVRSLTLIEPPAFWVLRAHGSVDDEVQRQIGQLRTFTGDITERQLEHFTQLIGLSAPGTPPTALPQWPLWLKHRQSIANSWATISHDDSPERVRDFEPPVWLVKGTGSAPFLHRIVGFLADDFPDSRLTEFPGGHAPQIASMDSFLEELQVFHQALDHPRQTFAARGNGGR